MRAQLRAVAFWSKLTFMGIRSLKNLYSLSRSVLAAVCLIACCTPAMAHAAEPEKIQIKYYEIPKGRVAFTLLKGDDRDIYVLDFETLTVEPLINTSTVDEYPTWSPDGTKLAFYSDISGDREIHVHDLVSGKTTQLTTSPGVDEDPDWSPDGKKIVFYSERQGKGSGNLYIMNPDGSEQVALTSGQKKNSVPKFSPDSQKILYSTNQYWPGWDILVLDIGNKKPKKLTSGFQSYCRGAWTVDGKQFAFSYGTGDSVRILRWREGNVPEELISLPGRNYDATWIDGDRLFFVNELNPGRKDFQLHLHNATTGETKQVLSSNGAIRFPSWTPHSAPKPPKPEEDALPGEAAASESNSISTEAITDPVHNPEPVSDAGDGAKQ